PEKIFVSARSRPAWLPAEVELVLDDVGARGPLAGVAAVLKRIETTHLLVLAVDLPQMTPGHLRQLWSSASPGVGIVPRHHGLLEPLCAIYPAEAAMAAGKALAGPDVSLHGLVGVLVEKKQVRFYQVKKPDLPFYKNVNTPRQIANSDSSLRQAPLG
ncbi:MAG TPA: NTP transferase domain-containing protein, partial [Desulfuromonadaceae bacterium]|nr:NTP transferase domain-containing protein [Desulfuromonadaceae bacterium]